MSATVIEPFEVTVARGKAMEQAVPVTAEDLLLKYADDYIQHEGDERQRAKILAVVDAATPHLDSSKTADWWWQLCAAIEGKDRVENSVPNWDDEGVDYDYLIDEALDVLTGKR